jgi:hypothetical protein
LLIALRGRSSLGTDRPAHRQHCRERENRRRRLRGAYSDIDLRVVVTADRHSYYVDQRREIPKQWPGFSVQWGARRAALRFPFSNRPEICGGLAVLCWQPSRPSAASTSLKRIIRQAGGGNLSVEKDCGFTAICLAAKLTSMTLLCPSFGGSSMASNNPFRSLSGNRGIATRVFRLVNVYLNIAFSLSHQPGSGVAGLPTLLVRPLM